MDHNVMRQQYRQLTDQDKADLQKVKDYAFDLYEFVHELEPRAGASCEAEAASRRCFALAKTKIEEAVMWATKGITT